MNEWTIKILIGNIHELLVLTMPLSKLIESWFQGLRAGKESSCNAKDLCLILWLGRSPGERNDYPVQYSGLENSMQDKSSWASLVAQVVRSPPAMQETWVLFLGKEDPLEQGMATHSSILAWRIP